jgi:hypothetical protein
MTAVYLQIPQTVTQILGQVVSLTLSLWLVNSVGKMLGGVFGNLLKLAGGSLSSLVGGLGNMLTAILPYAIPLVGALLIGAGIFAAIKGAIDHSKNMKEKDAEIDKDPNLTQREKDTKKLGNHAKSGAKVGGITGALAGAGTGALYGAAAGSVIPGVGNVVGGIVGAVVGAIAGSGLGAALGGLIGSLKPVGQMISHGFKSLAEKTVRLGVSLGGHIVQGAKWVSEHQDKLKSILGPLANTVNILLTLSMPFFILFKALSEHLMDFINGDWFSGLLNNISNPTEDDPNLSLGQSLLSGVSTAYNYVTQPVTKGNYVNMKDLGLKGTIDKGNSDPRTLKQNAQHVQQLDHLLSTWGFDIKYTSNMGGKHATGGKSHGSGNKVDLQLFKNGKAAHLSEAQLNILKQLGYWGGSTGALGWEKNAGQVGGGHYDLHIGNQVVTSAEWKQYQAYKEKQKQNQAMEEAKKEATKSEKEKEQDAVKRVYNGSTTQQIMNAGNPCYAGTVSGMDNYTFKQNNATTRLVEEGAN